MKITFLSFIVLSGISFYGCKMTFHPPTPDPGFNIEPSTRSIVIIDGGITTTTGLAMKKKRQTVVTEVKNQYLLTLAATLTKTLHFSCTSDTTLTVEDKEKLLNKDSVAIDAIENKYKSALILVLKNSYGGFQQGDVQKVTSSNGGSTSKVAAYSVFFETDWIILQGNTVNEKTVNSSRFHSNRTISSGLLARGPGFEANKKDISAMAEQNATDVALLFKY